MIFNLFCQYGKIVAIMLSEEYSNINYDLVYNYVFIEFATNAQAMKCKKLLSRALISKNNIRIKLTKYEEIDEVEDFEEDVGAIITYRDKDYLQRPSFCLKNSQKAGIEESYQPTKYQLVQNVQAHQIEEISNFISIEGNIIRKLFKDDFNVLAVEMENLNAAIKVLIYLNNIELIRKQYTKICFCEEKDFGQESMSNRLSSCIEEDSIRVVKDKRGIFL